MITSEKILNFPYRVHDVCLFIRQLHSHYVETSCNPLLLTRLQSSIILEIYPKSNLQCARMQGNQPSKVWLTWPISVCCWAPWLSFSSLCCSNCFLSTFNSACFTSRSVISAFNLATSSAFSPSAALAFCNDISVPVARVCSSTMSRSFSLKLCWPSFLAVFSVLSCSSSCWYSFSLRPSFSERLWRKETWGRHKIVD